MPLKKRKIVAKVFPKTKRTKQPAPTLRKTVSPKSTPDKSTPQKSAPKKKFVLKIKPVASSSKTSAYRKIKVKCPFCKNLILKVNMKTHLTKAHRPGTTFRFKCDKCNRSWERKNELTRHQCIQ